MKKTILILVLAFLGKTISKAQGENQVTISKHQNSKLWSFNNSEKADAYSWISKDGKRIYYTKDDSREEIWMAERHSMNQPFDNPVALKIEGLTGENEIFSSWLTPDESTLYFITRQSDEKFNTFLYKAKYNVQTKSFDEPKRINLDMGDHKNETSIFISGPSLSGDLSELYVYFSGNDNTDRIAYFKGKDGINYSFQSFINNAYDYCPGTISDDGLSFYLTLRSESNILVKLSRSKNNTDFLNPEYFIIDTMLNHGKNYYQPHVNADLDIISITYGTGTWQSNDIDIIQIPKTKIHDFKPSKTEDALAIIDAEEVKQAVEEENLIITKREDDYTDSTFYFNTEEIKNSDEVELYQNIGSSQQNLSKNDLSVKLYPNPANEIINLCPDFGNNPPSQLQVEIVDLNGKSVYSEQIFFSSSEISIETNYLIEGIYFCRITAPGELSKNKKFVISRS